LAPAAEISPAEGTCCFDLPAIEILSLVLLVPLLLLKSLLQKVIAAMLASLLLLEASLIASDLMLSVPCVGELPPAEGSRCCVSLLLL
jgi:hypothetical protein